ncbi:MAG: hypothetical protein WC683_03755 [bacterium]
MTTIKPPGFIPYLQLVPQSADPILPAAGNLANAFHSGNVFVNAGTTPLDFPGTPNRSAMRFASGADDMTGPARFAPPPSGGSGGDDGDNVRSIGPWRNIASFRNANAEARFETMRRMRSTAEIEQGVILDLANISAAVGADTRETQLDYLRGVMESMDLYSRSGATVAPTDMVRTVNLITTAASDLADFISLKKVEHTALSERVSSMMGLIISCANHLEHWIIAKGAMDRSTAEHLAHIYYSAAVKGAGGDAERERLASGPKNSVYMAHMANALLRLLDAQERFKRLGKTNEEREAMKSITTFVVHHNVPTKGRQWAIGCAANFLKKNVDLMYAEQGEKREELHRKFVRNVRFFTDGNRQFAPSILFHCQRALMGRNDEKMHRRFLNWAKDEMHVGDIMARI